MSWRVIWIPELLGAVLGGDFCVPAGYGNNAENSVACLRGIHRNAAGEPKV